MSIKYNKTYNNFYIVEEVKVDNPIASIGIMSYYVGIDLHKWQNGIPLTIGKIKCAEDEMESKKCGGIVGQFYSPNDIVIFDASKVIFRFPDRSVLVRDDAIVSLFDIETFTPCANSCQVIIDLISLDNSYGQMQDAFFGKVIDIALADINYFKSLKDVKVGDKILLVNPYKASDDMLEETFKKISTANGFYVIADTSAIACKVDEE